MDVIGPEGLPGHRHAVGPVAAGSSVRCPPVVPVPTGDGTG